MVTADTRTNLHQFPIDAMQKAIWRDFEPSDYVKHRKCGYVPTGENCHVCGKKLGKPLQDPYNYQLDILEDDHLTCLVAGGEQVGKSFTGAMKAYMILLAFLGEHANGSRRAANEVAWLVGASYEQTSREFEYLKTWLNQTKNLTILKADSKVDPGEIHIQVPGGVFKIKTKSSDDGMAALRMESPVFVLLCEAAICTYDTYTRLRSRVARARADFPGYGAIIMISTFEGSTGWYPTLYSKWQLPANQTRDNAKSFSMPSFSNIFIYKKGDRDPEIRQMRADLSEDEYKERVLAIPSPPKGRVFETFDPTVHILPEDAEYNPEEPVLIGIDPGFSGQPSSYAVEVVQRRHLPCGRQHFWGIDEIYETKLKNEKICEIAMGRFWWKNPHKVGVIDIAGTYHAGASDPVKEVWRKETGMVCMSEKVNILPGIYRMQSMLNLCVDSNCGQPVFAISPSMMGAAAEFGGMPYPAGHPNSGEIHPYRWATDRTGQVIGKTPEDKYCDAVRALTYLFINQLGHTLTGRKSSKIKQKKRNRASRDVRDIIREMRRAS